MKFFCWFMLLRQLDRRGVASATHHERKCAKNIIFLYIYMCVCVCVCGANQLSNRLISIVASFHGMKLCTLAARAFRSQQNGSVTRMCRRCQMRPSRKERAIGAFPCKKEGMLLRQLGRRSAACAVHHEQDVR